MDIYVSGKHVDVPEQVETFVTKKMERFSRRVPEATDARIQLAAEGTRSSDDRWTVQVTIDWDGTILRGEERGPDARTAFNEVLDHLDRQVDRLKGRRYKSEQARKTGRNTSIRSPEPTEEEPAPEEGIPPEEAGLLGEEDVARVKRFHLPPMTVDEAATQMQLLGHPFFLFLNETTGEVNLLYTREDGKYSLIEAYVG